eukprot:GHVU01219633.1.p3 GENE.GHVU01219633.1~~GHVU01219633.1.p3  ORF type:complete len:115 (+),score=2.84 GHVU01219633.1:318-662(+)
MNAQEYEWELRCSSICCCYRCLLDGVIAYAQLGQHALQLMDGSMSDCVGAAPACMHVWVRGSGRTCVGAGSTVQRWRENGLRTRDHGYIARAAPVAYMNEWMQERCRYILPFSA